MAVWEPALSAGVGVTPYQQVHGVGGGKTSRSSHRPCWTPRAPLQFPVTSVPIPAPQLLTITGPASPSSSGRTWWTNADQRKMQVRTQVAIRNGVSLGKGGREGILLGPGAGSVLV